MGVGDFSEGKLEVVRDMGVQAGKDIEGLRSQSEGIELEIAGLGHRMHVLGVDVSFIFDGLHLACLWILAPVDGSAADLCFAT